MESQRPDGYEELHRFRSRQACATSSKSALSKIQIPMAVMLTWCIDIAALTYWAGPTSLPVSDPSMAISRLWNSGKQAAWHAVEPSPSPRPLGHISDVDMMPQNQ